MNICIHTVQFVLWYFILYSILQVLHSLVSNVEKLSSSPAGCPLVVRCKNFQVLHFSIPHEQDCQDVYLSLLRLSQPGELTLCSHMQMRFSFDVLQLRVWECSNLP